MLFISYCSLFYALFAIVAVSARPGDPGSRRSLGQTRTSRSIEGLTPAQQYARTLTLRKPTRRATAQRRQESPEPRISSTQVSSLAIEDAETGSAVGNLVYEAEAWRVSEVDSASAVTYTGNPSTTSQIQRRLTYTSSDTPTAYTIVGVGQCSGGDNFYLKQGSANALCLVNAATGSHVGSPPVALSTNIDPSGNSVTETDIWYLDYVTGTAIPEWVNPDGTTVTAQVVVSATNSSLIFVTADIDATANALSMTLVPVTIKFALDG